MSRVKNIDDRLEEKLERIAAIGERELPQLRHVLPDGISKRERKALQADARFVSLRAYRRALDQIIAWALLGKISSRAAQEMAQTIRTASELLMSEHILTATGKMDIEPEHIDGEYGGAPIMPKQAPEFIETTIERRTGVGPHGEPIDETVVIAKGSTKLAAGTPFVGPQPALPAALQEDD